MIQRFVSDWFIAFLKHLTAIMAATHLILNHIQGNTCQSYSALCSAHPDWKCSQTWRIPLDYLKKLL